MPPDGTDAGPRLAEAVAKHYRRDVRSVARIPKGMGAINWLVRTSAGDCFLKQYPPNADLAAEAAGLALSQEARAAGVPAPLVIPSGAGDLLWSNGDLALALFEYFPGTTSGVPLSRPEMAQAGRVLGRLHAGLRDRSGLRDAAAEWLALDARRKGAAFERYLAAIESRKEPDEFDRRTAPFLHRRLALLPKAAALLASLPPLARQVVHGDYGIWNILFRGGELVAVVDFRPPELFLPAERPASAAARSVYTGELWPPWGDGRWRRRRVGGRISSAAVSSRPWRSPRASRRRPGGSRSSPTTRASVSANRSATRSSDARARR